LLTRPATRSAAAFAAAAIVAGSALAGCTAGDGSRPGDAASGGTSSPTGGGPTPGNTPPPYLPVPDGVVLTDPGSELGLGEQATVAWRLEKQPDKGKVAVLKLKVRSLVRADIKALKDWDLTSGERASALYYVSVTASNVGQHDLGGRRVPLYVLDGDGALVESSEFKTMFRPCPSPALSDRFDSGATTTVCLLFLVPRHGELKAVTFRPTTEFNPISWVGRLTRAKSPKRAGQR
jgi:hypothetical protein